MLKLLNFPEILSAMEKIRFWIRKHFGFTQKESNGFIILAIGVIIVLLSPPVFKFFYFTKTSSFKHDKILLDSLRMTFQNKNKNTPYSERTECSSFDPNSANEEDLKNILGAKISSNIIRFRKTGARFNQKSDLKKIYGMHDSLYQRIEHCIKISTPPKSGITKAEIFLDINKTDSSELEKIKGIGKVLASRIIRYRNRLGGFVDKNQYNEIYGLDSLTKKELNKCTFIEKDFIPNKININTAEISKLYSHPYIGKENAKRIIALRKKSSQVNLLELKSSEAVDQLERVLPYLDF